MVTVTILDEDFRSTCVCKTQFIIDSVHALYKNPNEANCQFIINFCHPKFPGLKLKFNDQELQNMKCPKCDFQAFYPQQYQSHIATHPEEIQKCKCCNFVSFEAESLLAHFKVNGSEGMNI